MTEKWLDYAAPFTEATLAEPRNLWFEWSRSVDEPDSFVLVEGFASTPRIITRQVEGDGWGEMGEITVG